MGLFSAKKKTYVSSTVYNLAGDELERGNFIKSSVIGEVLGKNTHKNFLGANITQNHFNGPGLNQRQFYRWARNHYSLGMPTASIQTALNVDKTIVASTITPPIGYNTVVQTAFINSADYTYWAEKHILENSPELIDTNWVSDIDISNNEIIIQYEDASFETVPLVGFDLDKSYLIAYYVFISPSQIEANITGSILAGEPADLTGWVLNSDTVTDTLDVSINETVEVLTEYTDGITPDVYTTNTTSSSVIFSEEEKVYSKSTYEGLDPVTGGQINRDNLLYRFRNYQIVENVVVTVDTSNPDETVTTTTTTESVEEVITNRTDYIDTITGSIDSSGINMLIYEMGSGTIVLDAFESIDDSAIAEFFPFLPIRVDNQAMNASNFPTEYPLIKKAYKKAVGKNSFDELLETIEDNENIDDIDFSFMIYGISINVLDNSGRKYLYEFFKQLIGFQNYSLGDYNNWVTNRNIYQSQQTTYNEWLSAQEDRDDPLYGTVAPSVVTPVEPDISVLRIKSDDPSIAVRNFDMRISWVTIGENTFSGLGKVGAKTGDVWFEVLPDYEYTNQSGTVNADSTSGSIVDNLNTITNCKLYYQDRDSYRVLTIVGMVHQNFVYNGVSVDITLKEAIEDNEESGFIVPMHYPTIKLMSLVDSTQMTYSNTLLVFNSYQVVKTKWYQTGLFKILSIAVLAFVAPYAIGAVTSSLITTVGFQAALQIGGALLNVVNGLLISNVLSGVSDLLRPLIIGIFGERFGNLIFTIATGLFLAFNPIQFANLNQMWGVLTRADSLLRMTNVIINGITEWIQTEIQLDQEKLGDIKKENDKKLKEVQLKTLEMFGSDVNIDPLMFTNFVGNMEHEIESSSLFLKRTMLKGSDIAQLSLDMIYDHAELTLELPKLGE